MEDRNKILILAIIIAVILVLGGLFLTYKTAYQKGSENQFQLLVTYLVQSAADCRPITIQLNEGDIQLVNPACYIGE